MSNVVPLLNEVERRLIGLQEHLPPPESLKRGSGDGTSGGMEARIAKLEAHVEHIRDDLTKLVNMPPDLATLKVRVDHLPTKEWMEVRLIGLLSLVAAIVLFADKLKAWLHLT